MANHLPSTDPPRRRVQFTVRTLIGAAFLISLFGAAQALPTEEAKLTATAFLVWVTFAGLYWTLGATGPLVALPVGTMVSAICWSLTLLFVVPFEIRQAGVWTTVPTALGWGILFSLILVLSRILGYMTKRLRGRRWRMFGSRAPLRQEAKHILSAWGVARAVLFTRLILSGLLALAIQATLIPHYSGLPVLISVLLDIPLFPITTLVYPSPPDAALVFLLVMAVLYCPLHAGTGWIVGFILTRMSRPALPTASRATNASPEDEEGSASCESPQPPARHEAALLPRTG